MALNYVKNDKNQKENSCINFLNLCQKDFGIKNPYDPQILILSILNKLTNEVPEFKELFKIGIQKIVKCEKCGRITKEDLEDIKLTLHISGIN
jgi:hypothetical protein